MEKNQRETDGNQPITQSPRWGVLADFQLLNEKPDQLQSQVASTAIIQNDNIPVKQQRQETQITNLRNVVLIGKQDSAVQLPIPQEQIPQQGSASVEERNLQDLIQNSAFSEEEANPQSIESSSSETKFEGKVKDLSEKLNILIAMKEEFISHIDQLNDIQEVQCGFELLEFIKGIEQKQFELDAKLISCRSSRDLILKCENLIENGVFKLSTSLIQQEHSYQTDEKYENLSSQSPLSDLKQFQVQNPNQNLQLIEEEKEPQVNSNVQSFEANKLKEIFGKYEYVWLPESGSLEQQFQKALRANSNTFAFENQPNDPFIYNSINLPQPFGNQPFGGFRPQPYNQKRNRQGAFSFSQQLNNGNAEDKSQEQTEFERLLKQNVAVIEQSHTLFNQTKLKQSFYLSEEVNGQIYQGDFICENKVRFTKFDKAQTFTANKELVIPVLEHFTFRENVMAYKCGTRLICLNCVENKGGIKVGPQKILRLCQECRIAGEDDEYILKQQNGEMHLVETTDPNEEKSTLIQLNQEKICSSFCIVQQFLPDMKNVAESINEIGNSIERKFVEYFFNNTIMTQERVVKVEKIKNRRVQMRFLNELQIIMAKNPTLPLTSLVKVLFHGTRNTNPADIVTKEWGLDMRYANEAGAYGPGIYFADNAAYSNTYAFINQHQTKQMLLCFVIVGDSFKANCAQNFRVPPNRPDGQQYDSVNGKLGQHYIIYDNNKQYPCYLITYK